MNEQPTNSKTEKSSDTESEEPRVPSSWPGAFGIYKYSRTLVKFNLGTLIILLVISLFTGIFDRIPILGFIITILLASFVNLAVVTAMLATSKAKKIDVGESFSNSQSMLLNMVLLNILIILSMIVGFILLIIPALIILPRIALAPYFLVDKKLSATEAYKASWEATKGHSGKVWGVIGVSVLMALPIVTIVGIPVTIYLEFMYYGAAVLLYSYITNAQPKPLSPKTT